MGMQEKVFRFQYGIDKTKFYEKKESELSKRERKLLKQSTKQN